MTCDNERSRETPDSEEKERLIRMFNAMTEWEKGRFMRFVLRVANKDGKALRLADLLAAGRITRRQLLEAM